MSIGGKTYSTDFILDGNLTDTGITAKQAIGSLV